jgi:AcrR family transcriptional regulator
MKKSEQTREKLFQTAMKLISTKGFEATTMRDIAAKASVAPGAIYYYFESKESLINEYYEKSHTEHAAVMRDFLTHEKNFEKRLHRALSSKIELALPYKDMARSLYRVAANPESSLSPFSKESARLRFESLKIFEEVVYGSNGKFDSEISKLLPPYLWLYQMGVILFWIYDSSENSKRTFELIDQTVPMIVSTHETLQSPFAAPFRKKILNALKRFVPNLTEETL